MSHLAIEMVLASAILHAIYNFFTKKSIDKQVFIWIFHIFSLLFLTPVFIYFLIQKGFHVSEIPITLFSGFLHTCYIILLSKSYESGDFSHVYPIIRSSPVLVLLFATLFLHEKVTWIGVLGICIVTFGAYIINAKSLSWKALLEPIEHIKNERSAQFAFVTLLIVSLYSIVDKKAVSEVDPIVFFYLGMSFTFVLFSAYVFHQKTVEKIKTEWKANKWNTMVCGLFNIISYGLILVALQIANVSYVVGMRQISILIAVMMGGFLLKERHKIIRISATCIIFVGLFLISYA